MFTWAAGRKVSYALLIRNGPAHSNRTRNVSRQRLRSGTSRLRGSDLSSPAGEHEDCTPTIGPFEAENLTPEKLLRPREIRFRFCGKLRVRLDAMLERSWPVRGGARNSVHTQQCEQCRAWGRDVQARSVSSLLWVDERLRAYSSPTVAVVPCLVALEPLWES